MTLWTVDIQAPLSTGLSKKEYLSGLPGPPPGDLPDTGIKPGSLVSPAVSGRRPRVMLPDPVAIWKMPTGKPCGRHKA